MTLNVFPYASGIAANRIEVAEGPIILKSSPYIQALKPHLTWHDDITPQHLQTQLAALPEVTKMCSKLAELTCHTVQKQQSFITLGGDHSCAIGTWSGVAAAIQSKGPLGLIWFDAHMDSHTPESSHSKNLHGTPLATLLGYGAAELTELISPEAKLKPENTVLVAIRCYESEEQALLESLNIKIFYMDEIKKRGFDSVINDALAIVTKNTAVFGISIDLDGLDPQDAPAVSVSEPDGVSAQELLNQLPTIAKHDKFIGAEIAEFTPSKDIEHKTEKLVVEIIKKLYFQDPND